MAECREKLACGRWVGSAVMKRPRFSHRLLVWVACGLVVLISGPNEGAMRSDNVSESSNCQVAQYSSHQLTSAQFVSQQAKQNGAGVQEPYQGPNGGTGAGTSQGISRQRRIPPRGAQRSPARVDRCKQMAGKTVRLVVNLHSARFNQREELDHSRFRELRRLAVGRLL